MGTAFQKMDFLDENLDAGRDLKRTILDIFTVRKRKVNEAAKGMEIASERLYKYTNLNSENNNLPAFLVPAFTKAIGPEFLMYIAHDSGYSIFKNPPPDVDLKCKVREGLRASREVNEALTVYWEAIEDSKVTYAELRRLRKEILEAVEALLGVLAISQNEYERGKA